MASEERKAYNEITDQAMKAYKEVVAQAEKAYYEAEEQMDEESRLSMWDIYQISMAIARKTMLRYMDESEMKHKQADETEGVSKAKESILAHYATGDNSHK